jgi:peptide/nickel transport system substrate-binding protein
MVHGVRTLASLTAVLALLALASTTGAAGHPASGGTLKVGWEQSFDFTDNLDPTGEYSGYGWGVLANLLVRTLVGYKHVAGGPGNVPVADAATAIPKPTNGGKTYTFHIKPGVMFGPPVNRQVTCQDFVNAMQRLASPKAGGQYGFYYGVIKGWSSFAAGKAKSISGIRCLDKLTIQFNLVGPTGDFIKRMSLPATGPQPAEVTKCFATEPGKYGLDLISTAGYMIQGVDQVDISSCSKIKSAPGYDGQTHLIVVRNPSYKQSTDPTRQNYPDQIQFLIDSSGTDIYDKVGAGQFDIGRATIPPTVLERYATNPSLRSHLFTNAGDRVAVITMNTTQPPFDDAHVRKALNWIVDKAGLRQLDGGPTTGAIANHIVPDTIFGGQMSDYAPYKTPGDHGSVAKAKAAMKGSKYSNGDGMCDASVCKGILLVTDARDIDRSFATLLSEDLKKIGITLDVHQVNGAFPVLQTVAKNTPIEDLLAWGKDYADAATFFQPLFDGRTIIPSGNTNFSLVGITGSQCKAMKVTGDCNPFNAKTGLGVPSVNAQLDKCSALIDPARTSCWEALDRYLTGTAAPWVPWGWENVTSITSNNVTHYQYDQFSTGPAWEAIAVKG